MSDHEASAVRAQHDEPTAPWLDALLVRTSPDANVRTRTVLAGIERLGIHVFILEPGGPPAGLGREEPLACAVREALEELTAGGVGPGLVGAIGRLPGLPDRVIRLHGPLTEVLASQRRLRSERRVPDIDRDPAWTLELTCADGLLERVEESLCTLSDGVIATRGSLEEGGPGADPLLAAAGIYMPGNGAHLDATPTLLPGPLWHGLRLHPDARATTRRFLDLRTATLLREAVTPGGPLRTMRFVSLARPGLGVLVAEGAASDLEAGPDLHVPGDAPFSALDTVGDASRAVTASDGGRIAASARTEQVDEPAGRRTIERRVVVTSSPRPGHGRDAANPTEGDLDGARRLADLYAEHRERWADRWARSDVVIEGDPSLQLAVRLGLFHLMAAAAPGGEAAVGARGLTGRAYRGHVFWDADVFVLPFLAATRPEVARAMVEYRLARLPAARRAAAAAGYDGARFPWESAGTGDDVTPTSVLGWEPTPGPIVTGRYQEHITADVVWAAAHYVDWTGDDLLQRGPGRVLLTETARYWASRVTLESDGSAHLRQVMGPDEYHAPVDDDVFTNAMATWNLRRAARSIRRGDPPASQAAAAAWRRTAAALVDGFDHDTGRHEQFRGYDELQPVRIDDLATPPVAADALLGREGVARTQIIKQADVLMRHHLLPDRVPRGSLARDLDHYLPRTAHGSSLSPGIHASLLARAGRPDEAVRWLEMAARVDVDDLTASTAGGIHLAAAGSVWQALVRGFLGVRPRCGVLVIDPHLPGAWDQMSARLTWRRSPLVITSDHDRVRITCTSPLTARLGSQRELVTAPGATFRRRNDRWSPEGKAGRWT